MTFPKYPEYKDSGVEWLGEIPAHWVVGPLRWYATIQGGVAKGKSYSDDTPTVDLPYLRVANVQDGHVDLSSVNTVTVALSEVDRYRLQPGDVLMNEGGDNDKLGRGTVWEGEITDCLHQNHVFAIRPNQHLLPYWLSMFTRSGAARSYFYLYSKQSTNLASISSSNVMSCLLPLPPEEEQRQILSFLDHETARIDALVEEQKRLIKLLKEKRQAVISHAVTKGLDPDVPMKDSGVEWLGEVPAHWDVVALKRIVEFQRGHDLPVESREPGKVPVVSSGGYSGFHSTAMAKGPGIVTGRYGSIGKFVLVEEDYWPLNTSLYSTKLNGNRTRYAWYLLHSLSAHFVLNSLKSAVPGVDRNDIHVVMTVRAPVEEQDLIVERLDAVSQKIDILVQEAQENISLLQERRSVLISAAVTGKFDVRGWQPPAGSSTATEITQTEMV